MQTVRQLIGSKGREVWSTSPDSTVGDALTTMAEKNVGALLVLEKGKIAGIFSERDYARKAALPEGCARDTAVRDLMSTKVLYIEPSNTLDECLALITEKRLRHLPVMENGDLLGIVSIGDIVSAKISEQEFLIDRLVRYVTVGW